MEKVAVQNLVNENNNNDMMKENDAVDVPCNCVDETDGSQENEQLRDVDRAHDSGNQVIDQVALVAASSNTGMSSPTVMSGSEIVPIDPVSSSFSGLPSLEDIGIVNHGGKDHEGKDEVSSPSTTSAHVMPVESDVLVNQSAKNSDHSPKQNMTTEVIDLCSPVKSESSQQCNTKVKIPSSSSQISGQLSPSQPSSAGYYVPSSPGVSGYYVPPHPIHTRAPIPRPHTGPVPLQQHSTFPPSQNARTPSRGMQSPSQNVLNVPNLPVGLPLPNLQNAISAFIGNDPAKRALVASRLSRLSLAQQQALLTARVVQQSTTPGVNLGVHGEELKKIADEDIQGKLSDEVFSNYKHNNILSGCQPHPGDIVEAGSLASIPLPKSSYGLDASLSDEIIKSGLLSSLQLEGILYACQRHLLILPNGTRAGFFIGDGAGVGKGRQIAGIVLDNFCRGRIRHVWFSTSTDLIIDAKRDLADIGCYIKVIEGCRHLDKETRIFGLPADFKEGVIFSTYATLVSSVQRGSGTNATKHSRLQQLIDWCGGRDFDGCLIFDECHKAKNFVPGKESASTKVALAVSQIQRLLPKARVVYCSATGVTDVKNMAFMERLGLWGDGAPFKSFDRFLDSVHKRGLGVAEMLAMEMKATGMYVSRGLSFKQAEFVSIEANLTPEQVKMYDTAAHLWNEMRKALDNALIRTKSSNNRVWASFWASHQRFFKQLCMGMKVPTIVKEANEALANGCCVVIGLQTTGEASLENERIQNDFRISGFMSLCREIFSRFIDVHFPTYVEGSGNTDESGLFVRVRDPWCVAAKTRLTEFAKMIELPNSPLDEIIDQLGGPDAVAEMTGRRARIVRRSPQDRPQYELRDSDNSGGIDSLNVRERNLFMDGKKLVAIISDAASTGISLHADNRVGNQCRRVHMTIELPWSADKAVQQLGRSHRSNQSSGPLYKLVTTNLGGERRFASAVARRLLSLGALTKGDRRAATGQDLSQFNFDSPYGRTALRAMYNAICKKEMVQGVDLKKVTGGKFTFDEFCEFTRESLLLIGVVDQTCLVNGMSLSVKDKESGDVGRFLNRILGLRVERQNLMFQYFCECLDNTVNAAKKEGRYNEGLLDITAASIKMVGTPTEVFKDAAVGDNVTKHITLNVDRGMSWENALVRLENYGKKDDGFYKSKREVFGRHLYLLATQKENSDHVFRIARPNTGLSGYDEEKADIFDKYEKIEAEDAEKGWKSQYEQTKDRCMHGRHCKVGPSCTVGSRCYKMHLLAGCIVTLLNVLESTLAQYQQQFKFSNAEKSLRVVRAQMDDGERVVGIRFPDVLLPYAEKALTEQKIIDTVQAKQISLSQPPLSQVLSQNQNIPVAKTVTETESGIISKHKNKAMTPPVTLKKFFQPVSRKESNEKLEKAVEKSETTKTVKKKSDDSIKSHFKPVSREASWESFSQKSKSADDSGESVEVMEAEDVKPIISSQGYVVDTGCKNSELERKSESRGSSEVKLLSGVSSPSSQASQKMEKRKSCFSMFKPVPKDEIWKKEEEEAKLVQIEKEKNQKGEDEDWAPGSSDSEDCCVVEVSTPSVKKQKSVKGRGRPKKKGSVGKKHVKKKRKSVDSSDDDVCEIVSAAATPTGSVRAELEAGDDQDFVPESLATRSSTRGRGRQTGKKKATQDIDDGVAESPLTGKRCKRPRRASAAKARLIVDESDEDDDDFAEAGVADGVDETRDVDVDGMDIDVDGIDVDDIQEVQKGQKVSSDGALPEGSKEENLGDESTCEREMAKSKPGEGLDVKVPAKKKKGRPRKTAAPKDGDVPDKDSRVKEDQKDSKARRETRKRSRQKKVGLPDGQEKAERFEEDVLEFRQVIGGGKKSYIVVKSPVSVMRTGTKGSEEKGTEGAKGSGATKKTGRTSRRLTSKELEENDSVVTGSKAANATADTDSVTPVDVSDSGTKSSSSQDPDERIGGDTSGEVSNEVSDAVMEMEVVFEDGGPSLCASSLEKESSPGTEVVAATNELDAAVDDLDTPVGDLGTPAGDLDTPAVDLDTPAGDLDKEADDIAPVVSDLAEEVHDLDSTEHDLDMVDGGLHTYELGKAVNGLDPMIAQVGAVSVAAGISGSSLSVNGACESQCKEDSQEAMAEALIKQTDVAQTDSATSSGSALKRRRSLDGDHEDTPLKKCRLAEDIMKPN